MSDGTTDKVLAVWCPEKFIEAVGREVEGADLLALGIAEQVD